MKDRLYTLLLLTVLFLGPTSLVQASEPTQSNVKLEKNIAFEDLLVQGKYKFSDEAVMTVEQDKVLDALLGVRKDFKDKILRSASRN